MSLTSTASSVNRKQLIEAMLTGGDTLGVLDPQAPASSLTFQLLGILRQRLTVVVLADRLMKDQVDKLRDEKGIRCVDYIVSGQAVTEQDEIMRRMVDGELRGSTCRRTLLRPRLDEALVIAMRRSSSWTKRTACRCGAMYSGLTSS